MKFTLAHGNVVDKLKEMADNSVDMIVTSPPYYGARNYSIVKTAVSTISEEDCIKQANFYMEELQNKNSKDSFYVTSVKHYQPTDITDGEGKGQERWVADVCIDISAIWGGNPECEHEFYEVESKLQHDNNNGQHSNLMQPKKANNLNRKIVSHTCNKCGAWKGNLGNEPTVELYIEHMLTVSAELMRVLKPTGYMMFNIGDTYGGAMGKTAGYSDSISLKSSLAFPQMTRPGTQKSLLLIPQRMLIGFSSQGWIIRNDLIWQKPNHKPESVLDRYTASYEHVFFMVKNHTYYWNLDAVRVPYAESLPKKIQSMAMKQVNPENQIELHTDLPQNTEVKTSVKNLNKFQILSTNTNHQYAGLSKWKKPDNDTINGLPDKHAILDHSNPSNNHSYGGLSKWKQIGSEFDDGDIQYNQCKGNSFTVKDIYETKFKDYEAGKNLADHIQNIRMEAAQSVEEMFPDDEKAQKEYIAYVHNHGTNPIGKNPGDVWNISTGAYKGAHTAVFPEKLAMRSLLSGPRKVCINCGSPEKLVSATNSTRVIWKGCNCNAGYKEAVALDPFSGAGTTFIAARKIGVNAIGIEINGIYIDGIKERIGWGNSLDIEYEEN